MNCNPSPNKGYGQFTNQSQTWQHENFPLSNIIGQNEISQSMDDHLYYRMSR